MSTTSLLDANGWYRDLTQNLPAGPSYRAARLLVSQIRWNVLEREICLLRGWNWQSWGQFEPRWNHGSRNMIRSFVFEDGVRWAVKLALPVLDDDDDEEDDTESPTNRTSSGDSTISDKENPRGNDVVRDDGASDGLQQSHLVDHDPDPAGMFPPTHHQIQDGDLQIEFATTLFAQQHGIPVPRIFGFLSDADGSIGAQCLVMSLEKGQNARRQLAKEANHESRRKIVLFLQQQLARIQSQFASMRATVPGQVTVDGQGNFRILRSPYLGADMSTTSLEFMRNFCHDISPDFARAVLRPCFQRLFVNDEFRAINFDVGFHNVLVDSQYKVTCVIDCDVVEFVPLPCVLQPLTMSEMEVRPKMPDEDAVGRVKREWHEARYSEYISALLDAFASDPAAQAVLRRVVETRCTKAIAAIYADSCKPEDWIRELDEISAQYEESKHAADSPARGADSVGVQSLNFNLAAAPAPRIWPFNVVRYSPAVAVEWSSRFNAFELVKLNLAVYQ